VDLDGQKPPGSGRDAVEGLDGAAAADYGGGVVHGTRQALTHMRGGEAPRVSLIMASPSCPRSARDVQECPRLSTWPRAA
jgi:hypothetical protein